MAAIDRSTGVQSEADDDQKANPIVYERLAVQAAMQIESVAMALRGFAVEQHEELDLFVISAASRLRELAGALIVISNGDGTQTTVKSVWGDSIESFAATLPAEAFGDSPEARGAA